MSETKTAPAKPVTGPAPDACGGCRFWLARTHMGAGVVHLGECRRYPPAPAMGSSGANPMTKSASWCGEYAARD